MILSFPRYLVGTLVLLQCSALATAQERTFPLSLGRTTSGTWKEGVDYEILYYMTIDDADGPSNQLDCVMGRLTEGIFVSVDKASDSPTTTTAFQAMTPAQVEQVEADWIAANPERQEGLFDGFSMSYSGGSNHNGGGMLSGPTATEGNSSSFAVAGGDNSTTSTVEQLDPSVAQSRQGGSEYTPTIQEKYHQQSGMSFGSRGALEYEVEINLGLYINGMYVNRFNDVLKLVDTIDMDATTAPKELEDFILEQTKALVVPEMISSAMQDDDFFDSTSPFYFQELIALFDQERTFYPDCIMPFQGDLAGDNPSLENTTIVGRSIMGDFEGQPYDLSVFFEFYGLKGADTVEQKQCFRDAVDSIFVTTPTIVRMDTGDADFVRSIIQEEYDEQDAGMMSGEMPNTSSIFWGQAGPQISLSMGGVSLSYQKGYILTLGGEYVRYFDDYPANPSGLEALVANMEDPLQDNLKQFFPINATSQLRENFSPMMSDMISYKPMKDGSGIFPVLFIENLIHCVNATALESYQSHFFGMPEESGEGGPGVLDTLVPPSLGDVDEPAETGEPDDLESPVSSASDKKTFVYSVSVVMLLPFVGAW